MSNPAPAGATPAAPVPAESLIQQIRAEILARPRFLITSHTRPDGDSIGSQLAMAYALDALGKQSRIINADRAPITTTTSPAWSASRSRRGAG